MCSIYAVSEHVNGPTNVYVGIFSCAQPEAKNSCKIRSRGDYHDKIGWAPKCLQSAKWTYMIEIPPEGVYKALPHYIKNRSTSDADRIRISRIHIQSGSIAVRSCPHCDTAAHYNRNPVSKYHVKITVTDR